MERDKQIFIFVFLYLYMELHRKAGGGEKSQ